MIKSPLKRFRIIEETRTVLWGSFESNVLHFSVEINQFSRIKVHLVPYKYSDTSRNFLIRIQKYGQHPVSKFSREERQ